MTTWVSLSLDLQPGSQPIHQKPRPLSPPDQEDLQRQLAVWLKQRVIVPAVLGAYALNLVPVRKKGVAASVRRWTIDARPLNACTIPRPEFIGTVTANLENLAGKSLFIAIDMANSFLSIPLKPEDAHKLSFVTARHGAVRVRPNQQPGCPGPVEYSHHEAYQTRRWIALRRRLFAAQQ